MKIITPSAFALVCLLANVSARNFTAPTGGTNKNNITTAAVFDSKGANMEVCPSGDCANGKFMKLSVASLTELDKDGKEVAAVTKFSPKDSDWTTIKEETINDVNASSTTLVSSIEVGSSKTKVEFNLTATIFQGDATVTYGSQSLTVPAGALKFTVDMNTWPFGDPANTLTLAVKLDSKGPKGKDIGKPEKKPKGSSKGNVTVERVDLGDSMFMDAPSIVILDGVEKNVTNSSVVVANADTLFEWVFPHFAKTLHYDPVLGDASTSNTSTNTSTDTSTSSSGSSSESSSGSSSSSSASKLSLSGLAAAGLTALAYSLF
ncbi:putative GPI-anchored serine-threonine rich hypothetical protein [Phytophthora infestans T30-4]|uniref:Uncharacterized protein n=2 Tax=Phytophthora infestans TaxID=4787 RepID=D0NW59_PHYIT|nr:putative GPI-anchored serine-threonine rich hypothetical protein [Phytophthora infestans T30-4]EEY66944.1 putative GPI-anchored serine-threonine rich hypothetical protein [Phytophthora infestans T30-4]KAF4043443.1 hypothetical protein GN244_ATG04239 [Phytophthora infestans]KAF4137364.1 hypothetical protein GN958_ATG13421 [Phytophthora infestans]KAI9988298.1 hypothetical protein PInf_021697 [Phytophthora infestans]|eukprot:XP_002896662.1 putative GPI-anchored serine-threonine rich hypothetical protein [Phytophthora infestans T30-4]